MSVCRVVFIPNYNVKLAEIVIPGSDVSQVLHSFWVLRDQICNAYDPKVNCVRQVDF